MGLLLDTWRLSFKFQHIKDQKLLQLLRRKKLQVHDNGLQNVCAVHTN